MNKKLFLNLILIFTIGLVNAQNSLWTKTSEAKFDALQKFERVSTAQQADFYTLNFEALKTVLQTAPTRNFSGALSSTVVNFPNANGTLEQFSIYESSVMAPELAAEHPEIQSYVGQSVRNPSSKIFLTTTVFGLHAMVLTADGTYYIDTFTTDLKGYIVYKKSDLSTTQSFNCYNEDAAADEIPFATNSTLISDSLFRTYRLAMACTIEYAAFHVNKAITAGTITSGATVAEKKSVVLAAMNVTVSRVNSVYETDMSLRMQLVANNEDIIFITSDNFTNSNANSLINESQTVINAAIGFANYDIGHTVSTGGGGLAQSPSVCTSGKAKGITGSNSPVGDPFDIDYVAHEMGHQFGAFHTFNGTGGSCTGNRSAAYAVEPGSGSTIMAYAGICSNNVQANSDSYFQTVSITQMTSHITGFGNCASAVENFNAPPVIADLSNYTIPKGTPFVLTGSATDDSSSALTYCWEQTDKHPSDTSNPNATTTNSIPNFRTFTPSLSPKRYFPALPTILAGSLTSTWEVIPNVARTMNFALTVRDNNVANGGQTERKNMTVTFNGTAGPFKVTSQNAPNTTWFPNETQTITWDVAGTTAAPVSTANVKILLSTDGGYDYNTVLVESTPNDGSHTITVPNISAPFCRIMVQPVDNVYFAINSSTFAIGQFVTSCVTFVSSENVAVADGTSTGGPISSSTITIPNNFSIIDLNIGVNISHTNIKDLKVTLRHPDNTPVRLINRICTTQDGIIANISDGSGNPICTNPVVGTFSPNENLSTLNAKSALGNWKLELQDFAAGDTGTLNSWSILVCYLVPLKTETFELNNLTVSPNPSNGNFNVQFNSTSDKDILINVYDISGRQIFAKSYPNQSIFAQNIQLSNVQSGVYLVNIQNGNQKSVRKIVIQ